MLKQFKICIDKAWPRFFSHKNNVHLDSFFTVSNYRRFWAISVISLITVALLPLWFATVIHYQLIHRSMDSELILRLERVTSNAKRAVSFFMEERLNALTFTVNEMGYVQLTDTDILKEVFHNLKLGFGGFSDLSVIDSNGNQVAYVGPFDLEGKNYSDQPWFEQSMKSVNYVSDVFTGYRDAPHIIIAVRSSAPDGSDYLLRATLDTERLMQMLWSYKSSIHTDIFLINHEGILQTPSPNFGSIFSSAQLKVPEFSTRTKVKQVPGKDGNDAIVGYSYISTEFVTTPFILMVHKEKEGVMQVWLDLGKRFNWILGISGLGIVFIITLISTFMVNKLYLADRAKAETMIQMEQSHQLASIGQLAAGIAHEINNPLALISETAGYVMDLYQLNDMRRDEDEIIEHIGSILEAVERCGTITRQLLGFVRQFDIKIKQINIRDIIGDVISFHKKEAEYRKITVNMDMPESVPVIETDSGKLQQILLNLINNAFQALDEGGRLDITVSWKTENKIDISIKDTGCGIPEENIKKIQEPFFSTKKEKMGTGLGLSITYNLVKKLGGNISVESKEGVGTTFTITLPVRLKKGSLE